MTATELPRYTIFLDVIGRWIVGFGERDGVGRYRFGWVSVADFEREDVAAVAAELAYNWSLWRSLFTPADALAVVSVARDECIDKGLIAG